MLKAGDKHLDHFWWGDTEQYHTVQNGEDVFQLFDYVRIVKDNGITLEGQIGYIDPDAVHILPEHCSVVVVMMEEIHCIKLVPAPVIFAEFENNEE